MVRTDRAPPQACPYGIGEPPSCPYCRQDADPGECQIVAVMRPGGWKPRSAFDMPKDCRQSATTVGNSA